jgi:putative ABC transport system ATP-binding protein
MFTALVSADADTSVVNQKVKKLIKITGIEKLADHTTTKGSGGQLLSDKF